jgi:guanylate kinase
MSRPGTLFILSAPSGAGKSSLIAALLGRYPELKAEVSVSHTTRAARPGEQHGHHYYFVDHNEFEQLIHEHAFYEYAEVFGNYYGTARAQVEARLQQGCNVFLDIDWQGARQVRKLNPDAISVFILPPSRKELERRLRSRGQDSDDVINTRMQKARAEMSHHHEYDYLLVNQDFDKTVRDLASIVRSCELRQPGQAGRYRKILGELLAENGE